MLAGDAAAHGFGARYDLPIPLTYYVTGAGLAVGLSFAMCATLLRPASESNATTRRPAALPGMLPVVRVIGVAICLLVVFAGITGTQSPLKNIAPVLVWAISWVGLSYVSAFVGNVWLMLNPFDTLFQWGQAIASRRKHTNAVRYPAWLGVWPAVVLFLVFVWMEIVWDESDRPAYIAAAILAYAVLTWLAMTLVGRDAWLRHGEVFTLVFGLLARFAPLHFHVQRTDSGADRLSLQARPYAVGLLAREPLDHSRIALVMVLLAAVSFDGFVETPAWATLAARSDHPVLLKSVGLVVAPCLFLMVFLPICRLSAMLGHASSRKDVQAFAGTWRIAGLFATTLVPIAIAYHVAHYLSFLAMAGQYLIPLVSDPMGWRWDLFGTTNHFVRPGWVDARVVWNASVAAIVTGHVAAIYLAHRQALQEFGERRAALRSQYPMLGLMVAYTMLSLWIIAQPIVSSR